MQNVGPTPTEINNEISTSFGGQWTKYIQGVPESIELDLRHSKHKYCLHDLPSSKILQPVDYTESDLKWKMYEEEIMWEVLTKLIQLCCHLQ